MRAAAFPPMPSGLFESYFTVFPRKWQEKYADSPAHDLRVAGKQISAAVLAGGAALAEAVCILDVQHQQPADLLLGQPCRRIEVMEPVVCLPAGFRAVVLIALPDDEIHRHPGLRYRLIGPVPLGGALEIGREQIGPHPHDAGHGLPAAGVALGIDLLRVDVIGIQQVFGQGDGLHRRGLPPVTELRGGHDHAVVVMQCLEGKVLTVQVLPHPLEVQPLIAGKGEKQGIGLTAVVAVRDVDVIVDVPLRGVEHIVHLKAPVGLCPLRDLRFRLRSPRGGALRRRLLCLRRRLRGGLHRSFSPAGGETQLHSQRQKKRKDLLDGKHCGTFFHKDCSPGEPPAEVPIG